jgi:DNA-binding MarR family transcriptional regulator
MRPVEFDAAGAVVPPLRGDESIACVACGTMFSANRVDDEIGVTVREQGVAICHGCESTAGFERGVLTEKRASVADRWGADVAAAGWTPIPDLLLTSARELKLRSTDLAVIAALESFDWAGDGSYIVPSKEAVAERAGCSPGTAGASLTKLEKAGLAEIESRRRPTDRRQTSNRYSLHGLKRALALVGQNRVAGRPLYEGLPDLLEALRSEGEKRHLQRCPPKRTPQAQVGHSETEPQEAEERLGSSNRSRSSERETPLLHGSQNLNGTTAAGTEQRA